MVITPVGSRLTGFGEINACVWSCVFDGMKRLQGRARKSRADKTSSTVLAIAVIFCGGWMSASSAQAFEIFGFRFFEGDKPEVVNEVPDPLPYVATLTVSGGDKDLEKSLLETSQLIQQQDTPPSGSPGLISRALGDQQQLIALLYVKGLYGGTVNIDIAGRPLQAAVEAGEVNRRAGTPVPVAIHVVTGPQFHFGTVSIRQLASDGTPAATLDPAKYGLVPGAPALSDKILQAESRIVADLKDQGYPLAKIADRSVVADHASNRLDVTISANPGPAATFGHVTVQGQKKTKTDFIIRQAEIDPGSRYDPAILRRAAKRLRDLGIFASVRVIEADRLDSAGNLPITIEVAERKRHVIGGGGTISSVDGIGLEAYWRHRNLFGAGETLSLEGSVGRIVNGDYGDMEYSTQVVFTKPGVFGPATSFSATVGAKRENPEAYESRAVFGSMKLTNTPTDKLTYSVGTEFEYSRETDVLGPDHYALFGVFGDIAYDTRDNILNPTRGLRATFHAEPAYDAETGGFMAFTKASLSTYWSLSGSDRFILANRVAGGSILTPSLSDVAPSRRYYVGGGGSVRGYAYRNVGPRVSGEVIGGRSFFETSTEIRTRITESFGAVGFVDAGAAYSSQFPDFSEELKVGVGAGLRYFSPIGPLRLDVAVPLAPDKDDPDFAIYVGLSQAF